MPIVLRPLRSIFATRAASFRAPCALDEAVERLRAVTKSGPWRAWWDATPECLVGKVSQDAVVVGWYRGPRARAEQFRGAFSKAGEAVVLEGRFQHATGERWLLVVAVALCGIFLVTSASGLAIVLIVNLPFADRLVSASFLAALTATTTAALFFATQPLSEGAIERTSQAIRQAFDPNPSNSTLQRPGVRDARPGR